MNRKSEKKMNKFKYKGNPNAKHMTDPFENILAFDRMRCMPENYMVDSHGLDYRPGGKSLTLLGIMTWS